MKEDHLRTALHTNLANFFVVFVIIVICTKQYVWKIHQKCKQKFSEKLENSGNVDRTKSIRSVRP